MKKYYLIGRNMWDQISTYRFNFIVWRIRNVARLLTLYFLWEAILGKQTNLFGYSRSMLLTYILLGALLDALVFSSQSFGLADEINNGTLSNFLLRPLNYFFYWAAKDIGDKTMNVMFFIMEFSIFLVIIHPPFFLQTNIITFGFFIISISFALLLSFLCYLLLGMIGFWSNESWAPRFLFVILLNFFAGGLVPLNMLPSALYTILKLLPFTYLYYFPLRIYLGLANLEEIFSAYTITILWIALLYLLNKYIWSLGLKLYTAQGR